MKTRSKSDMIRGLRRRGFSYSEAAAVVGVSRQFARNVSQFMDYAPFMHSTYDGPTEVRQYIREGRIHQFLDSKGFITYRDRILFGSLILFAKDNRTKFEAQFGTIITKVLDDIIEPNRRETTNG